MPRWIGWLHALRVAVRACSMRREMPAGTQQCGHAFIQSGGDAVRAGSRRSAWPLTAQLTSCRHTCPGERL